MEINDFQRVEITMECETVSAEYADCGSHRLDVTMVMRIEDLEEFVKEYNDEYHKIVEAKNRLAALFAQNRRDNDMEDTDGI